MSKPIEIIATMILNGGKDLLKQYHAIDYPVNRYFILDNSMGKDYSVQDAIDQIIVGLSNQNIKEVCVLTNRMNVGFAGSCNQIVQQNTDVPYWIIMGCDWHPRKNQLEKLAKRLEKPFTGILCDETQNAYSCMVLTPEIINKVGTFDENFFPGYYEDNDHRHRMRMANLKWENFPLTYNHAVSSTLKRDVNFQLKNEETFASNGKYYVEKWGGLPGNEKYERPFNNSELPIDYWKYNPQRSEKQRWI